MVAQSLHHNRISMNVVVVESPAKAKTILKYLGRGFEVLASFGHVRDLPAKDGSVESGALRLGCDRELEIGRFVAREFWSLVATLATPRNETFEARLVGADGKKIQRLDIGTGAEAEAFRQALDQARFSVASVEAKP